MRAMIFSVPSSNPCSETQWRPNVDVYQSPGGWLLKYDLAGVEPEDVHVTALGRTITVSGVRRDWAVEEGWRYYSMEISYSRFERSVELPCALDDAPIRAEFRNGILIVRIGNCERQK